MNKIFLAVCLTYLTGCAQLEKLQTVYSIVTETTVPGNKITAIANTFDVLEAGGTQYLIYCKGNLSVPICSADNRRNVIKYTRIGRSARNQLEPYIVNGAGPASLYNLLVNAVSNLQSSPAITFGAKQ